jgi:hypothetical protein
MGRERIPTLDQRRPFERDPVYLFDAAQKADAVPAASDDT